MSRTLFARVFEALRNHTGLVVADFARNAGMRRQRCLDISCGRAIPRDDEVARLTRASLLTAAEIERVIRKVDPGGGASVEIAIRERAHAASTDNSTLAACAPARLTIDYLSVTADVRDKRRLVGALRAVGLTELRKDSSNAFVDDFHRRMAKRYRRVFRGADVEFCFVPCGRNRRKGDERKDRYARIGIPGQLEGEKVRVGRALFALLDLRTSRVTRIDIAVDVDVSFGALHLVPRGKAPVEVTTYLRPHGFETVGCKFGDGVTLKSYDWTSVHGGTRARTRFEACLKPRFLQVDGLSEIRNPFTRVVVVALPSDARGLTYPESCALRDSAFYSAPYTLARLGVRQRARVKSLLLRGKVFPAPSDVFARRWRVVLARALRRLGIQQ